MIGSRYTRRRAGVAQTAEQLTRNEQVKGSSPFSGSIHLHPHVTATRPRAGSRAFPYAHAVDLAALSDTALVDSTGVSHRLGDLWRDRPIVLVFLRHFG